MVGAGVRKRDKGCPNFSIASPEYAIIPDNCNREN